MSYGIKVITPSTVLPVTLDEAKLHLKVDTGTTEDALITGLIYAAQEFVENYCRTRLTTTVEELYLDQFPFEYSVNMSKWPISAITSVNYLDVNGVAQVLDSTAWRPDIVSKPGRVCLEYARYWPIVRWVDNAVWVRYSVGFGATAATIPYGLKQALLLLVGHLYQNRSDVLINTHVENLPNGAKWIMDQYRYVRL